MSDNIESKSKTSKDEATLLELFSTADYIDCILMTFGTIGGIITGCCFPAFCILFGFMLDALNRGDSLSSTVNSVCILFVIVGSVNIVSGFVQVCGWSIAGERQAQRLRVKYVSSVLSQEVGWFDTCGSSELSTLVTDLTGKVQDGITRRVGDLIQNLTQFIASFIVSLYLCWELSVVLIAAFPLIAACGSFMIKVRYIRLFCSVDDNGV